MIIVIAVILAVLGISIIISNQLKEATIAGTNDISNNSSYNKKIVLNYTSRNDTQIKEIFNMGDHKIYTFGGDVTVIVNNIKYSLEEALNTAVITEQDILKQVQSDTDTGLCQKTMYYDGGSTEYLYSDHTVAKLNTIHYEGDTETDLIIGMPGQFLILYNNSK